MEIETDIAVSHYQMVGLPPPYAPFPEQANQLLPLFLGRAQNFWNS